MAELVSFYDDFVTFQARCAFFCDACNALAARQQWESNSQRGLSLHSADLKDELEQLRQTLHQLLQDADRRG